MKDIYKFIFTVLFIVIFTFFFIDKESDFCNYSLFFFKNRLNVVIKSIEKKDFKNRGIFIYYTFENNNINNTDEYLFKNTDYFHQDYPEIYLGDSISKEANTEDFKLYRKGVLIFDGVNLPCLCKYCEE